MCEDVCPKEHCNVIENATKKECQACSECHMDMHMHEESGSETSSSEAPVAKADATRRPSKRSRRSRRARRARRSRKPSSNDRRAGAAKASDAAAAKDNSATKPEEAVKLAQKTQKNDGADT